MCCDYGLPVVNDICFMSETMVSTTLVDLLGGVRSNNHNGGLTH